MGSLYCRRPSVGVGYQDTAAASGGPRDSQWVLTCARLGGVRRGLPADIPGNPDNWGLGEIMAVWGLAL
jgi:hypothetical protein